MSELPENVDNNVKAESRHPTLGQVLILIIVSFLLSMLVTFFLTNSTSLQFVIGEGCLIIPSVLFLYYYKYDFTQVMRLRRVSARTMAATGVLALAVPFLNDEIDRLVGQIIKTPPELEELIIESLKAQTFFEWVALLLGAVVVAGVVEEILFRGLLLRALERRYAWPLAIYISAFAFAMVHPIGTIPVFLIGTLLAYMAWRTQSIFPGILLHSINNLSSLLALNFGLDKMAWYEWQGHVNPPVVAIAACVCFYAFKWFRYETGKEIAQDES